MKKHEQFTQVNIKLWTSTFSSHIRHIANLANSPISTANETHNSKYKQMINVQENEKKKYNSFTLN